MRTSLSSIQVTRAIAPAHYLLPRPSITQWLRGTVVQLAAHAKSSTLYGRSYGRTSKFFRLDGLLLFRIISSAIKKWKVKNENRVFQRLVRKKRKKHRMLLSVLVLWSGLKRSWFLKPKEERSYLYECRQMWATKLIAIKQKRNGTTSIAIYMRRVSRITKYTKMDPKISFFLVLRENYSH